MWLHLSLNIYRLLVVRGQPHEIPPLPENRYAINFFLGEGEKFPLVVQLIVSLSVFLCVTLKLLVNNSNKKDIFGKRKVYQHECSGDNCHELQLQGANSSMTSLGMCTYTHIYT